MRSQNCLYVGVDFSKANADIAFLPDQGPPLLSHQRFANSQVGFSQLKELILSTLQSHQLSTFQLAGEATSYYWLPLFLQFSLDPDLAPFDPNLFLLNARWVKWFKKSKSPNHKDDTIDPAEIADYVRERQPEIPWEYDPHWLSLRFYTRMRAHLVKGLTREKNHLNLFLFLAYSAYSNTSPFSYWLSKTSQKLLSQPEWMAELSALPPEELAIELDDLSAHQLHDPVKNALALKKVFEESFPLDLPLVQPIRDCMLLLLDAVHHYEQLIEQVERMISNLIQSGEYPEVAWLDSIPGVGLFTACGIAAEIGNLDRFTLQERWDKHRNVRRKRTSVEVVDAVSKYAGLWWPKNASGEFEAEELRMSCEGNAYLRFYILEAADKLRQFIPSFHAYYSQKYAETKKHKHKRAVVLTGSKCLDLFVALLRKKEFYRPKEGDSPTR